MVEYLMIFIVVVTTGAGPTTYVVKEPFADRSECVRVLKTLQDDASSTTSPAKATVITARCSEKKALS